MGRNGRNRKGKSAVNGNGSDDAAESLAVMATAEHEQPQKEEEQKTLRMESCTKHNVSDTSASAPAPKTDGNSLEEEKISVSHAIRQEVAPVKVAESPAQLSELVAPVKTAEEKTLPADAFSTDIGAIVANGAVATAVPAAAPSLTAEELVSPSSCSSSSNSATAAMEGAAAITGSGRRGRKNRVHFSVEPPVILGAELSARASKNSNGAASPREPPGPAVFEVPVFANARCSTPSTGEAAARRAPSSSPAPRASGPLGIFTLAVAALRKALASPSPPLRGVLSLLARLLLGFAIGALLPAKLIGAA